MSDQANRPIVAPGAQPPRLLDQLRALAVARFGRPEPAERYVSWARRFIVFHGKRHPRELALPEVGRFLEHVVQAEKDPLGSLEQAREALAFLYDNVVRKPLGELPFTDPPPRSQDGRPRAASCRARLVSARCGAGARPRRADAQGRLSHFAP